MLYGFSRFPLNPSSASRTILSFLALPSVGVACAACASYIILTAHPSPGPTPMLRSSLLCLLLAGHAVAGPLALFPPDKKPADRRIATVRTLDDKDFFLRPPATKDAWQARAKAVREQLLVSQGLWPMWPREKISATIGRRVDRDGYSIEAVYFASTPGHYVTGSLYRPRTKDGKLPEGKLPAVLCAHGHWTNARMMDTGEAEAKKQIDIKAETYVENARQFLQAKCVTLARLGCVVFQYDMVGHSDSKVIGHAAFADPEAELRLQNLMGLQTFNSLRALDFVAGLPEVDPKRIGMTGASGGGTQTFMLAAIDDRIAAAVPAVMVSVQMQGGCVCENASYLRIGTGNVEITALAAPRPVALTAARDWTIEIEKKGLPELKAVYKLFDAADHVQARCWPEFGHNYNQPAREYMYDFFNQHLKLGHKGPVREAKITPVAAADLTAFPTKESRPADFLPADRLRQKLTELSDKQIEALLPADGKGLAAYREVMGPALRVMLTSALPQPREVESRPTGTPEVEGATAKGYVIGRRGAGEQVPVVVLSGKDTKGTPVVWISPGGKADLVSDGKLVPAAKALLDKGCVIVAPDVFNTGELTPDKPLSVNPRFAGYTFGYNRPQAAQRAHDVLTTVAFARSLLKAPKVHLVGDGKAGPWALLARGLCGDAVARTAVDLNRFRFEAVRSMNDEMMLPGGLKYGGLGALAGLAAPGELYVHNHQGSGAGKWLKAVYKAAGAADRVEQVAAKADADRVVNWLLR